MFPFSSPPTIRLPTLSPFFSPFVFRRGATNLTFKSNQTFTGTLETGNISSGFPPPSPSNFPTYLPFLVVFDVTIFALVLVGGYSFWHSTLPPTFLFPLQLREDARACRSSNFFFGNFSHSPSSSSLLFMTSSVEHLEVRCDDESTVGNIFLQHELSFFFGSSLGVAYGDDDVDASNICIVTGLFLLSLSAPILMY